VDEILSDDPHGYLAGIKPAVRADPHSAVSELHRLPDRIGDSRVSPGAAMRYTIRHVTRFAYETSITESVMEARMQPRSDGQQRCLHFALSTMPASRVRSTRITTEHRAYFNVPGRHFAADANAQALGRMCRTGGYAGPLSTRRVGAARWDAASGAFLGPARAQPVCPRRDAGIVLNAKWRQRCCPSLRGCMRASITLSVMDVS